MKLAPCKTCGHQVAGDAAACPSCGAPIKRSTSAGTALLAIVAGVVICFVLASIARDMGGPRERAAMSSSPPSPTLAAVAPTEEIAKQPGRKKLIEDLIRRGIFYKAEASGHTSSVYVTPKFYSLPIDQKQAFVSAVYSFYATDDLRCDLLGVYDSQSGKQVGKFGKAFGGLVMD